MLVGQGVPGIVIDAIEDAAELVAMATQGLLKTHALLRGLNLPGIAGRDSGDGVGIDDTALHGVDGMGVARVAQPVRGHEAPRVQAELMQDVFPDPALMPQVVQGVADPGPVQAQGLVGLVEEDRNEPGVPVMAVDDVRVAPGLVEKLQQGPGIRGEAVRVVRLAMNDPPVKKVLGRLGVDKPAVDVIHLAPVKVAGKPLIVKGHPEIGVGLLQPDDRLQPQAVVLGQDDLDPMPRPRQFPSQAVDEIPQAAGLGHGGAFGAGHDDIHKQRPPD